MIFLQKIIPYDVIICGTGPIGLSMAALLHKHGISSQRIALIDLKLTNNIINDPRSIALTYFSQQVLQKIDAWKHMVAVMTEIYEIHISRYKHFGRILIRSEEYGLPAFGYVIRYHSLIRALTTVVTALKIIRLGYAQIARIEEHENYASLYLIDGQKIDAAIIIQAEGKIYTQAQLPAKSQRDYNQIAIVSYVQTSTIVSHRAFERFTAEGPLALLPEIDGYALVWCMRQATADKLLKFDNFNFLQALQKVIGSRVGCLHNLGPRSHYYLSLSVKYHSKKRQRVISIGNAAQTLHPVAGQGFNLGLRDVVVLSKILTANNNLLNQTITSQQFSKERYCDRKITCYLTDLMARVFTSVSDDTCLQTVLGVSLGLIDLVPPIKRILIKQMIFGWR